MAKPTRTVTVRLQLTTVEAFVLGAVLAAAEGVNLSKAISMSAHTRDAITIGILILGSVVKPLTPAQFLAKIPQSIITIVQAVLGGILVLQQSWSLGTVGNVIIGVVIVVANTLGLGPVPVPGPAAAK